MGIFSSIRDAIFGKPAAAAPAPRPADTGTGRGGGVATAPRPETLDQLDVEHKLDAMSGADRLNWRTSIVDLMKLIDVDSDYESRKKLAEELGNTSYSGSAEDNIQLHRQVMRELAKNGGKVPAEFLD